MIKQARFVGGPIHDTTLDKPASGRWSTYRNDVGDFIRAPLGDREFCTSQQPRRYYAHQDVAGVHLYIHATAWDAWNSCG